MIYQTYLKDCDCATGGIITKNKPLPLSYNELLSVYNENNIYPYGEWQKPLLEFFKSKITL